jgi:hypothetical protein
MAQSTPAFEESSFTTAVNWTPVVLPTIVVVVDGLGFRAMEIAAAGGVEWEELPPHAASHKLAPSMSDIRIVLLAATAGLLQSKLLATSSLTSRSARGDV